MRKLWRTLLTAGILSLVTCLFAGITVFAEKVGGELCEGFTWSFDGETGTLTLTGEGECPFSSTWSEFEEGGYWRPYEKQIQKVYLDGLSYFRINDCLDHVNNFSGHINHKLFWEYDKLTTELIVNGQGEFPADFPIAMRPEILRIEDGITVMSHQTYAVNPLYMKKIFIGKDCQFNSWFQWTQESLEVDPQNPYMSSYKGCLYTKDFTKLLCCPCSQSAPELHPNLKIIGSESFIGNKISTFIVPWGVTTIEDAAFYLSFPGRIPEIILPDTVISMEQNGLVKDLQLLFIYSQNNQAVHQVLQGKMDSFYQPISRQINNVAQYYPDVPEAQGPGPSSTPTESTSESSAPASQPESKPESKPESSAPASSTPASQPPESKPAPESSAPAQSSASSSEPESSVASLEEPSTEESSIAESSQEESAAESSGESSESTESEETSEPEGLPTVEKEVGGKVLWIVLAVVAAAGAGFGAAFLVKRKK